MGNGRGEQGRQAGAMKLTAWSAAEPAPDHPADRSRRITRRWSGV